MVRRQEPEVDALVITEVENPEKPEEESSPGSALASICVSTS